MIAETFEAVLKVFMFGISIFAVGIIVGLVIRRP